VASTGNAGCFKINFTMVFQMILCGECYENVFVDALTMSFDIPVDLIFPAARWPWGRSRNVPGGKGRPAHEADLTVNCLENMDSLDVSQPYGLTRPATGIALALFS
jgi:hypothetical protein